MKQIKYTPDAADKLRSINRTILMQYGSVTAKKIIGKITGTIRSLAENENKGPSVKRMFGIETDCCYIFVAHNYVQEFHFFPCLPNMPVEHSFLIHN